MNLYLIVTGSFVLHLHVFFFFEVKRLVLFCLALYTIIVEISLPSGVVVNFSGVPIAKSWIKFISMAM